MSYKKLSFSARNVFAVCTLTAALTIACQGPETVEMENIFDNPNDDEYSLDLFFLSELAGRIVPQKEIIKFNIKTSDGDCSIYLNDENSEDKVCLDKVLKYESDNKYILTPYAQMKELNYSCTCQDNDGVQACTCPIWRSGAEALDNVWNKILKSNDNTTSARIGSGDNFGVSLPLSSHFDDMPTVLMLNNLNLNIETLGNHNFDNGLNYLQNAVSLADFKFIISNLNNLPNNLENTASYSIIEVPSKDNPDNSLPVAVISALDPDSIGTISRGTFGTLNITDYCSIVNSLEDAYNKNIRSFIIVSHFTEDSNILNFMKIIYNLHDSSSYPDLKQCSSRLFVSSNSVNEYLSKEKIDIANADSDKREIIISDAIKTIRENRRKEIFDGILLIYGSAYSSSILTRVSKELIDSCDQNTDAKDNSFQKYLADNSVYNNIKNNSFNLDELNHLEHGNNYLSFAADETDKNEKSKDYVWFIELPAQGTVTAKAKFLIQKQDDQNNTLPGTANRYHAQMISADFLPVYAKEFYVGEEQCTKDSSPNCKEYDDFCVSIMNNSPKECGNYYNEYKKYNISLSNDQESDIVMQPSFDACMNALLKDKYYSKQSFDYLQKFWSCAYNITSWKWLKNEQFFSNNICLLLDNTVSAVSAVTVKAEGKNTIRAFSTFIANLFTDAILKFVVQKTENNYSNFNSAGGKPDAVLLNAGTFRGTTDFTSISNDFLLTVMPVDYDNKPVIARINRKKLAEILEFEINSDTNGAFPAIAGFHFSYDIGNNTSDRKTVTEILKVNEYQHYTEIYFLEEHIVQKIMNGEKICIMGLKNSNECRIGEYFIENNTINARIRENTLYSDSTQNESIQYNKELAEKDSNVMLKVLISDYMSTGGDGFNEFFSRTDAKQFPYKNYTYPDGSKMNLRNMVTEFFKSSSSTICSFGNISKNSQQTEDSFLLLKKNLIKRIYTNKNIPSPDDSNTIDQSNASCAATQRALAAAFGMEKDCFYDND